MQYTLNMDIDIWEWLAKNPEANARFNTFMEGMRGSRPHWTDWFPVQERVLDGVDDDRTRPLLVDIGGGRGHDIACFAERFPNAPGQLILEELPAVIDDIATLDPRIQRMKHDFFTPQPVKGRLAPSSSFVGYVANHVPPRIPCVLREKHPSRLAGRQMQSHSGPCGGSHGAGILEVLAGRVYSPRLWRAPASCSAGLSLYADIQ